MKGVRNTAVVYKWNKSLVENVAPKPKTLTLIDHFMLQTTPEV